MADTSLAVASPGAGGPSLLYGACAAIYMLFAILVLVRLTRGVGISRSAALLAVAAVATAAWAACSAWQAAPALTGPAAALDLLRSLAWYGFVLHLYRRTVVTDPEDLQLGARRLFTLLGVVGAVAVAAAVGAGDAGADRAVSLLSPGVALRLALAVCQLLLLENLYRNTQDEQRWNLNLACIGLGGVAAFDLLLCTDAALFHRAAAALIDGRPVAALLVAPLLAVAQISVR